MKFSYVYFCFAFSLLLGCNTNNLSTTDELSINDIVNQSIEKMETVTSYTSEMNIEQTMTMDSDNIRFNSHSIMDIIPNPLTYYQQTTIDSDLLGETVSYDTYYSREHGLYMEDPFSNEWVIFPESVVNDYIDITDEQINLEDQLKPLLKYLSDVTLTSDDDNYILQISGEGKAWDELSNILLSLTTDNMYDIHELITNMEIQSLDYKVFIDKNSFYHIGSSIQVITDMEFMDDVITSVQTTDIQMNKFNEVTERKLPKEIMDNAIELSEEDIFQ